MMQGLRRIFLLKMGWGGVRFATVTVKMAFKSFKWFLLSDLFLSCLWGRAFIANPRKKNGLVAEIVLIIRNFMRYWVFLGYATSQYSMEIPDIKKNNLQNETLNSDCNKLLWFKSWQWVSTLPLLTWGFSLVVVTDVCNESYNFSEINQPIEMMTGKNCIIHHLISLNFPPSCQVLTSSWCVLTDDGLSVGFCCQQPNGKHLGGRGDQLSLPPPARKD